MRAGCTPKAIRHQVSKMRNSVKAGGGDGDGEKGTKPAKATAPKATTTKKVSKKAAARTPSPDADGGMTPPPTARPKRIGAKRDYAKMASGSDGEEDEDDKEAGKVEEDGMSKKVKIEVGEDIGEGLRQMNEFEEAMAAGGAGEDVFQ